MLAWCEFSHPTPRDVSGDFIPFPAHLITSPLVPQLTSGPTPTPVLTTLTHSGWLLKHLPPMRMDSRSSTDTDLPISGHNHEPLPTHVQKPGLLVRPWAHRCLIECLRIKSPPRRGGVSWERFPYPFLRFVSMTEQTPQ